MTEEQRGTVEAADRYADGIAETAYSNLFEEDGRFSPFVAATEWEGDEYYIPDYHPDRGDEPLLVHKDTHEIFQADVWVSLQRTGDKWFAPDDHSDAAEAQRARKAKEAERRQRQVARLSATTETPTGETDR